MLNKFYFKSCKLLFLIFPISIVFSNLLANFTVYYLAIAGIYIALKKKKYVSKNIFYFLLIFWVYLSARSLFTPEILFSWKSSLVLIRYLFFIITVSYLIENDKSFIKNFSIIFFLFISLLFIDAVIQFFFKKNLLGYTETVQNRISSFFEGRFVLGSYISKIILLAFIFLNITYPLKKYKLIYLLISFLSVLIILISGDRAVLLLFILSLFTILALLDKDYITLKQKVLTLFFVSIVTFILIFSVESFKKRYFFQTLNDLNNADKIFFFSKGHESHWKTSYKMFLDNKLFGKGPNMFRFYCDNNKYNSGEKSCSTHPHNYHIQLLAETGLVGYFMFLCLYVKLIFHLAKQFYYVNFKRETFLSFNKVILLSLIFSNFWPIITTGNIFSSFTLNLVFITLSFYFLDEKNSLNIKK